MHPNRKKIVLVIVEGPSDETALGVIMNRLFRQNEVIVHVMRSDITSELSTTPGNIVSKINMSIRSRFGASFKSGDFLRIIHIVDTDGAFVDESAVVQDEGSLKTEYTIKEIHTKNREKILERNVRKSKNLKKLLSVSNIHSVPYNVFYMSCNLDHVLYNKMNSSDEAKEKDSWTFAKKYQNNIPEFIQFIGNSDFTVADGYHESWNFIMKGLHSLERHTNFVLCLSNIERT